MDRATFAAKVDELPCGKRLPDAVYLHRCALDHCQSELRVLIEGLLTQFELGSEFNVLKLSPQAFAISFLSYPEFDAVPHPALAKSLKVDLRTGKVSRTEFSGRDNPPILHRKETLLSELDPRAATFAALTLQEEEAGLYQDTRTIGFRLNWERLLRARGLSHAGHDLVADQAGDAAGAHAKIDRHKTALVRYDLSKPVKLLLEFGLLKQTQTFFDFGCGLGGDIQGLSALGYSAAGWDPVHAPDGPKVSADVVNLGYVLNVIENPAERVEVLVEAWENTRELLLVSVLVSRQQAYNHVTSYGDGVLTRRNTFQKFFEAGEIQLLLEETLGAEAIALGLGIFVIFRDGAAQQDFVFAQNRRRFDWERISGRLGFQRPKSRSSRVERLYSDHRELLDAFWSRMLELGRVPLTEEFERTAELVAAVRSPKTAERLFVEKYGADTLEQARARRREDLLVYLAMAQFRRRVLYKHLSHRLKGDVKGLIGDYSVAEAQARDLLFAAGDPGELEIACEQFAGGVREDNALIIHRDLLDDLPALVRVYIGCGALLYGDPRAADLIKVHIGSNKLTFLHYDDFAAKALPKLLTRIKINMRTRFVQVFDHSGEGQLLYFKERFMSPEASGYADQVRFSARLRHLNLIPEQGLGPTEAAFLAKLEALNLNSRLNRRKPVSRA